MKTTFIFGIFVFIGFTIAGCRTEGTLIKPDEDASQHRNAAFLQAMAQPCGSEVRCSPELYREIKCFYESKIDEYLKEAEALYGVEKINPFKESLLKSCRRYREYLADLKNEYKSETIKLIHLTRRLNDLNHELRSIKKSCFPVLTELHFSFNKYMQKLKNSNCSAAEIKSKTEEFRESLKEYDDELGKIPLIYKKRNDLLKLAGYKPDFCEIHNCQMVKQRDKVKFTPGVITHTDSFFPKKYYEVRDQYFNNAEGLLVNSNEFATHLNMIDCPKCSNNETLWLEMNH